METKTHRDIMEIYKELQSHPDFLIGGLWGKSGILQDLIQYLNEEEGVYQYDLDVVTKWFYDGGWKHSWAAINNCLDYGYIDSDGYEYPVIQELIELGLVVESE
jgi:hypothetical protein